MFLVTGATGFIGTHVVEKLVASGRPVRALVRRADRDWPCPTACCDLAAGAGLEDALDGVDAVIHLAGATKGLTPEDYYRANVVASTNLARALAGRAIRLVHVSSLAAAGPNPDATPVTEDAAPHPVSAYGRSKLAGERAVRGLKPDAVVVRPPVVYGPRDTGVFKLLKSVSRGWSLEIGGGERWFSSVYVADLVDGLIRAATEAPLGRTYYLAHPKPATWSSLAATAAGIMGVTLRVLRLPVSAAYAVGYCAEIWSQATRRASVISRDKISEAQHQYWVCSPNRAAEELGWRAATSMEQGLDKTLAWYKEAGWIRY
ncbi:MAG TPA: NAD-dependent epimerase/dehydratase family protein [Bryobacteraceae bacterium]|nr:NAD-dependent epimerase/dehydratase family protein [Bryobacteraceae bacterium]